MFRISSIFKATQTLRGGVLAIAALLLLAETAAAVETVVKKVSSEKEVDKFGMPMSKLKALEKKHKCKDIVRYREVIPYFGMEKTKEISKEIAIGVEKEDIKSGKAKLVDVQYDCFPILGNFYVNCTTDVTLCYVK